MQPPVPPTQPQITDVTNQENFWDRPTKPYSLGDGDWENTLEHLVLNLHNYIKTEQDLQDLLAHKKFGGVLDIYLLLFSLIVHFFLSS